MSTKAPVPRLTVITLGVSDMRASIAFYEALGLPEDFAQPARPSLFSTPAAP